MGGGRGEVGPPQKLAVVQHLSRELFDAFKYRPLKRRQGRVRKQNGSYGLDLPGIVRRKELIHIQAEQFSQLFSQRRGVRRTTRCWPSRLTSNLFFKQRGWSGRWAPSLELILSCFTAEAAMWYTSFHFDYCCCEGEDTHGAVG